jgi:hypothetical protein
MNLMNCGGSGGDNWNMNSMVVDAWVSSVSRRVAQFGSHRFSADWSGPKAKHLTIPSGWQFRKDVGN